MRTALCIACGLLAILPADRAQAQTKLTGKMTCAKPDPNYNAPVGDDAHHVLSLGSQKCTWSEGDLGGDRLKDEADTFTSDVSQNLSHDRGYGVGSVASGDKYVVKFKGTTTLKGEKPVSADCTWSFKSGTGKLKGLTGKGTCKATFSADGTSSWDIQGEYKIP
ncbi:MAG TPA: hypothetical protein VL287_15300 [Gemmatimonadales bacterium]|jgi:hypothetical protein|nr:hypothetical protein [Gemmatimonadales bacterium]